jgi:hypothetical protein
MKNFKYILIALICICTLSCKKSDDFLYNDTIARIQFGPALQVFYRPANTFSDSLKLVSLTSLSTDILVDTVYFDIYTMGKVSDMDRRFALKQEQVVGGYNAVPGVHYKAFTDSDLAKNYVIKAGQSHSLVPIILLRDASLKTNSAVLKFSIVANDNFQPGQEQLIWRKVIFTDRISKPAAWTASAATTYYGKYSEVKHRFMISHTGQLWDDAFLNMIIADTQLQAYWIGIVKSALAAYNKAHPGPPPAPLIDEVGELVVLP